VRYVGGHWRDVDQRAQGVGVAECVLQMGNFDAGCDQPNVGISTLKSSRTMCDAARRADPRRPYDTDLDRKLWRRAHHHHAAGDRRERRQRNRVTPSVPIERAMTFIGKLGDVILHFDE
jgi:hypothetical protein